MNKVNGKNEIEQELDTLTFKISTKYFQIIHKYKGCI